MGEEEEENMLRDYALGIRDREEADPSQNPEVKVKRGAEQPTAQEIAEHMVCHVPFRAWCPHCVSGKAKCNPHFKRFQPETGTPTISMDYMYMRSDPKKGRAEERGSGGRGFRQ